MRILIATDAWRPQVNGVVRSLESMAGAAGAFGARVDFVTPRAISIACQCRPIPKSTWRSRRRAG